MSKAKMMTPVQIDAATIAGIFAAVGAERDAREERAKVAQLELEHDWRVGCIRQAHATKRGRALIAEAIPDKEDKFKHICVDNYIRRSGIIEIRIVAKWGIIEYKMKATKRLKNVRRKLDAVRDELRRVQRERRSTRPRLLEARLRVRLKMTTPQVDKARSVILREMRKLLEASI